MTDIPSDRDDEIADLRAQDRHEKMMRGWLLGHPDPRDPDWPGHWVDDDTIKAIESQ